MPLITPPIKNIKEVTEPLKEEILKGDVHTIEEMRAWLQAFGYSDAINDAAINFILREFVMSKVSCDEMSNMDIIVEFFVKPDEQSQTRLSYGMARKGRMKTNQSLSWDCTIIVTLLVRQVHL